MSAENNRNKHLEVSCDDFSYEKLKETANYIKNRIPFQTKIGIICGSGLGFLSELLKNQIKLSYEELPNFPICTVKGHHNEMIIGELHGQGVILMKGRFHSYEGYSLYKCTMPVRVLKLLGVEILIVTNIAGALNTEFQIGDIMIIKDHFSFLTLSGLDPLRGPNMDEMGPRFPSMIKAYNQELIEIGRQTAKKLNIQQMVREGVYINIGGPSYSSFFENSILRNFKIDAIGMSTIPEVIVAKHCQMEVFAMSVISDLCPVDINDPEPDHDEILKQVKERQPIYKQFISQIIENIKTMN